jgi:hypothetical protein
MVSSGILRRVALVRTDVSEEPSASFIRVTRIGELGKTLAATSNRRTPRRNTSVRRLLVAGSVVPSSPILVTLMKEALGYSETSVLTRATRRNIPEDNILHSHRRENLKSYTANVVPRSPILVTVMMEALRSSETSILTRAIRCNIPEDGILQCFYHLKKILRNKSKFHSHVKYLFKSHKFLKFRKIFLMHIHSQHCQFGMDLQAPNGQMVRTLSMAVILIEFCA